MEATKMFINRGMDKEDVVHIYTKEYYSTIKKNKIMSIAQTWMDLAVILLRNKSDREDKYYRISLTSNLK